MHPFSTLRRPRRGSLVTLIIAGLLAVAAAPLAQTNEPDTQEDTYVDRYLAGVSTLRANFRQVLLDERGEVVDTSSGTLLLSRPDRFRWSYDDPFADEGEAGEPVLSIVADGERLWVYDADLAQATVKRMDGSLASNPAMLLSGQGRVSDGFEVVGRYEAENVRWTELEPKESDTDFRTIRLGFTNDELAFMELKDSLDQVTRIEFLAVALNVEIDSARFAFEVPAGVDVIGDDPLYDDAVRAVRAAGVASPAVLQERLGVDAQRAAGLIIALRDGGVLGDRDADGAYVVRSQTP